MELYNWVESNPEIKDFITKNDFVIYVNSPKLSTIEFKIGPRGNKKMFFKISEWMDIGVDDIKNQILELSYLPLGDKFKSSFDEFQKFLITK